MKITLAIFAILLALSAAENECRIFSCGSIDQTDGQANVCANRIEADGTTWNTEMCPVAAPFCQTQAAAWNTPTAAPNTASCAITSTLTFGEDFVATANVGLDGDFCAAVENCFATANNVATCTDGMCKSVLTPGDDCTVAKDDRDAPRGHFCADDKKVTAFLANGDVCTRQGECGVSSICLKMNAADPDVFMCTAENSIADGGIFSFPAVAQAVENTVKTEEGLTITTSSFQAACTSFSQVILAGANVGKSQCRAADKNSNSDLSRAATTDSCEILSFNADAEADFATENKRTVSPKCGFNQDNKAWCPLQIGDAKAQDYITKSRAVLAGFSCHRLSQFSPKSGSVCNDYLTELKKEDKKTDLFLNFRLGAILGDTQHQIWANTANNQD
jgi:hypothetical protein